MRDDDLYENAKIARILFSIVTACGVFAALLVVAYRMFGDIGVFFGGVGVCAFMALASHVHIWRVDRVLLAKRVAEKLES